MKKIVKVRKDHSEIDVTLKMNYDEFQDLVKDWLATRIL